MIPYNKYSCVDGRSNRPQFQHVLLPRTSGLQLVLDSVGDVKPDIYDLTMVFPSYSGEIPTFEMGYDRKIDTQVPSMKTLLAGKYPGSISLHAKKYSYDEAYANIEQFLDTRWAEKDARMEHYIKHQSFPIVEGEITRTLHMKVCFIITWIHLNSILIIVTLSTGLLICGIPVVVWRDNRHVHVAIRHTQFLPL